MRTRSSVISVESKNERNRPARFAARVGTNAGAGLTPGEALKTATYNPAKFLGMLDRLGTIEKGKLADLVLLDANPLEGIRNTQQIRTVVVNGRYLDQAALDKLLADAAAIASTQ
jgi:imidazolonepropionase-like amidohydrolase